MIPVLVAQVKCSFQVNSFLKNQSFFLSQSIFYSGPPLFGLPRPPFFPPQFMPPNPFMLHPRFPMQPGGPHGMISPIPHLITNGNDTNTSEMIDSPNSASYDTQLNGVGISPISDGKHIRINEMNKIIDFIS
jgi:hypothetical protein